MCKNRALVNRLFVKYKLELFLRKALGCVENPHLKIFEMVGKDFARVLYNAQVPEDFVPWKARHRTFAYGQTQHVGLAVHCWAFQ